MPEASAARMIAPSSTYTRWIPPRPPGYLASDTRNALVRPVVLRRTHVDRCWSHTPLLTPAARSPPKTTRRPIGTTPGGRPARRSVVTLVLTAMVSPRSRSPDYRKGTGPGGPVPFRPFWPEPLAAGRQVGSVAEEGPLAALVLVQVHHAVTREQLAIGLPAVGLGKADEVRQALHVAGDGVPGDLPGLERRDVDVRDVPTLQGVDPRVLPELRLVVGDELGARAGVARGRQEGVVLEAVAAEQRDLAQPLVGHLLADQSAFGRVPAVEDGLAPGGGDLADQGRVVLLPRLHLLLVLHLRALVREEALDDRRQAVPVGRAVGRDERAVGSQDVLDVLGRRLRLVAVVADAAEPVGPPVCGQRVVGGRRRDEGDPRLVELVPRRRGLAGEGRSDDPDHRWVGNHLVGQGRSLRAAPTGVVALERDLHGQLAEGARVGLVERQLGGLEPVDHQELVVARQRPEELDLHGLRGGATWAAAAPRIRLLATRARDQGSNRHQGQDAQRDSLAPQPLTSFQVPRLGAGVVYHNREPKASQPGPSEVRPVVRPLPSDPGSYTTTGCSLACPLSAVLVAGTAYPLVASGRSSESNRSCSSRSEARLDLVSSSTRRIRWWSSEAILNSRSARGVSATRARTRVSSTTSFWKASCSSRIPISSRMAEISPE